MAQCSYNGCKNDVGIAGQDGFCVCHVRGSKNDTKFSQAIREQILNGNYNFAGYIFLEYNFSGQTFPQTATFRDAIFTRHADFGSCKFNNVDFEGTVFEQGADFNNANFNGQSCTFRKSHFKGIALFTSRNYSSSMSFAGAIFENDVNFRDSIFKGNDTSFRGCTFKGKSTIFYGVTFDSKKLTFEGAKFSCPETNIEGVCFETSRFNSLESNFTGLVCEVKSIDFHDCTFEGIVSFNKSNFLNSSLNFHSVTLNGDECSFEDVKFGTANFSQTVVKNRIRFDSVAFSRNIDFENLTLGESSFFSLRGVKFALRKRVVDDANNSGDLVKIQFRNTIFPPLRTYFENISSGTFKSKSYDALPTVCFEYCHLKDSYFIENDMVHFSFRHTMLTEIVFINNEWYSTSDAKDRRRNVLIDELKIKDISISEREVKRVTELYIQLKTAHDRNNDYENSGYFYFNQMELTRKLYLSKLKELPWELTRSPKYALNRIGLRLKSFFYYLYKVIAGYGQKPLWSFYWILFALFILFPYLHMVNGFSGKTGTAIRYSVNFTNPDELGSIAKDYLHALIISISHSLPLKSYISASSTIYAVSETSFGIFLSWLNTIVLLALLGLMLMGIRRHFKRY